MLAQHGMLPRLWAQEKSVAEHWHIQCCWLARASGERCMAQPAMALLPPRKHFPRSRLGRACMPVGGDPGILVGPPSTPCHTCHSSVRRHKSVCSNPSAPFLIRDLPGTSALASKPAGKFAGRVAALVGDSWSDARRLPHRLFVRGEAPGPFSVWSVAECDGDQLTSCMCTLGHGDREEIVLGGSSQRSACWTNG